jgi:hypothetical protein
VFVVAGRIADLKDLQVRRRDQEPDPRSGTEPDPRSRKKGT